MDSTSVCRGCLSRGAAVDIFGGAAPLREMLELCAGVPLDEREALPRRVCEPCRTLLLRVREFRVRARRADDALRRQLVCGGPPPDYDYELTDEVVPTGAPSEVPEKRRSPRRSAANGKLRNTKKVKRKKLKSHNQNTASADIVSIDNIYAEVPIASPAENGDSDMDISLSTLSAIKTEALSRRTESPDCRSVSEEENHRLTSPAARRRRRAAGHVCERCGYRAADRCSLRVHQRFHTGERPFACPHCAKAFAISANLKAHARVHSGERPFVCEWCGRALSTAASLRGHVRVHTGERPYACATCPRRFALASNLRAHARVHSGERPYACDVCGKRFTSSSDARAHRRTHTGERPHACAACPRRFALASNLRAHARTHAAARAAHPCALCAAEFDCRSALSTHVRTHKARRKSGEEGRQHVCEACGRRFSRRSNLLVHERRQACAGAASRGAAPANRGPVLVAQPHHAQSVAVQGQQILTDNKMPLLLSQPPRPAVTVLQIGSGGELQLRTEPPPTVATVLPFTLVPLSILR